MNRLKQAKIKFLNMSLEQLRKHLKEDIGSKLPRSIMSPITFKNMVIALNWSCSWGGSSLEYDKHTHLLKPSHKAYRFKIITLLHIANFTYFSIRTLVLLFSFFDFQNSNNNNTKGFLFDLSFGFLTSILHFALLVATMYITYQKEIFIFIINTTLHLYIDTRDRYANQFAQKWRNGCEELLSALRIFIVVLPFLVTFHFLQHPENRVYPTSLISNGTILYYVTYGCFGVMRFCLQVSSWAAINGITCPVLAVIFPLFALLIEMSPGRPLYRTKPAFRRVEILRNHVRIAQIFCTIMNTISRTILPIEQLLVIYTGTICAFSVIRFWDQLSFSARGMLFLSSTTLIGLWTTILALAVKTYKRTEKMLDSWRNFSSWTPFEKKLMKKFRKSVRPLRLEFGGFYYITPKKQLAFWNTLIWLIVRALLTFPDQAHIRH